MSHTPRKSWIARHTSLTVGGAVIALVAVGACTGPDEAKEGSGPKPSASASKGGDAAPKPAEEKKAAIRGKGTFEVGKDVQPGTYRTTGNGSAGCYWERAKDSSGEVDSILANENATGPAIVTIGAEDGYFKTSDCGDWKKAG
ncbi:hypothetical protein ACFWBN_35270 [Streptomyces sp. NPDC059989]|uniref:hypothetical protein n=1 Tax=Streptomyces sp. NPDC059989 TaxID=3347026 RepID=UPI0036A6FACB